MRKIQFSTELAYLLGLIILAFGTALMEKADFGMSMVVAPAYLLYLRISETLPFFTFGMAEYLTQALLLLIMMMVLRSFKLRFLFSFLTTLLYGAMLDFSIHIVGKITLKTPDFTVRLVYYFVGMLLCSVGVALLFQTYLPQEAYELFVKEISEKFGFPVSRCKTVYDICSCLVAVALSFGFFGLWHFEGVKLGTIFCALVNGSMIGFCMKAMERTLEFRDCLKKATSTCLEQP